MDRRVEKTRASIINAFLSIREGKALERMTVKEICDKADINKSTFYTHFRDIYALSEELETKLAANILKGLGPVDQLFNEPEVFTKRLYHAYLDNSRLTGILFSGARSNILVVRIEESFVALLEEQYPGLLDLPLVSTLLTLEIYGGYNAFQKCRRFGEDTVISILSSHSRHMLEILSGEGIDIGSFKKGASSS